MKKAKISFALITLAALALMLYAGIHLKIEGGDMSKGESIGWGAIFVAASLTVVRGIKYLGQK
ncbi:hypothetical protein P0Y35_01755 [Kiritimatiellaeota bacterium B1221]|nr:hypothetical protein [Kiritimatiellaeota bacterium B1221]